MAAQFNHLPSPEQQQWWIERMERPRFISGQHKRGILHTLLVASVFESFLATKYPASKRFGVEGCEALIPGVEIIIRRSAQLGVSLQIDLLFRRWSWSADRGRFDCDAAGVLFALHSASRIAAGLAPLGYRDHPSRLC